MPPTGVVRYMYVSRIACASAAYVLNLGLVRAQRTYCTSGLYERSVRTVPEPVRAQRTHCPCTSAAYVLNLGLYERSVRTVPVLYLGPAENGTKANGCIFSTFSGEKRDGRNSCQTTTVNTVMPTCGRRATGIISDRHLIT